MTTPGRFGVTLDGREYIVDLQGYQARSVDKVRGQGQSSDEFGESTLNPLDLWRRSQSTWLGGAGQDYFDKRSTDDRRRFLSSSGIDPWTDGKLQLTQALGFYDQLSPAVIGAYNVAGDLAICYQDGADWDVDYLADFDFAGTLTGLSPSTTLAPSETLAPEEAGGSFTASYTETTATVVDAVSDGARLYVLDDTEVVEVNVAAGTSVKVATQTGDIIGWVKGRLFVGNGYELINIESSTTKTTITPAATLSATWQWTAFGESSAHIYAAGHASSRADIYRITIAEDGTSLGAPTVAAELPFGEICHSILGYVGAVFIGTTEGIRYAVTESDGALNYGRAIDVGGTVKHMVAWSDYIYFSVDTGSATAIGRLNLATFPFPEELQPAWAIDLWDTDSSRAEIGGTHASETMTSLLTDDEGGLAWVLANNDGGADETWLYFADSSQSRSTGTITSSRITYDLPDRKSFERIVFALEPFSAGASVDVSVIVDGTTFFVGTMSEECGCNHEFSLPAAVPSGEDIQYQLVFNRADDGTSPVVTRATFRSLPQTRVGRQIQLPIILREAVYDGYNREFHYDPTTELSFLRSLENDGSLVTLELFKEDLEVVVDAIQWGPELEYTSDGLSLQGIATVIVRSFADEGS